jgi:allophanate hydrolase subunit 2
MLQLSRSPYVCGFDARTRLEGERIERRAEYVEQSRPMVIGAIEVPGDGAPIVLGPEHPTTGGYPVLAVIASDSLDAFHSVPLGGSVRFVV